MHARTDTDGGGWAVFQHRMDGTQDFYLYWDDYRILHSFREHFHSSVGSDVAELIAFSITREFSKMAMLLRHVSLERE